MDVVGNPLEALKQDLLSNFRWEREKRCARLCIDLDPLAGFLFLELAYSLQVSLCPRGDGWSPWAASRNSSSSATISSITGMWLTYPRKPKWHFVCVVALSLVFVEESPYC